MSQKSKQLCKFFPNCTKADKCTFMHADPATKPTANDTQDTQLCFFFKQGKCTKGDNCQFSHGQAKTAKPKLIDAQKQQQVQPVRAGASVPTIQQLTPLQRTMQAQGMNVLNAPVSASAYNPPSGSAKAGLPNLASLADKAALQLSGSQGGAPSKANPTSGAQVINVASLKDPMAIKKLLDMQKRQNESKKKAAEQQKRPQAVKFVKTPYKLTVPKNNENLLKVMSMKKQNVPMQAAGDAGGTQMIVFFESQELLNKWKGEFTTGKQGATPQKQAQQPARAQSQVGQAKNNSEKPVGVVDQARPVSETAAPLAQQRKVPVPASIVTPPKHQQPVQVQAPAPAQTPAQVTAPVHVQAPPQVQVAAPVHVQSQQQQNVPQVVQSTAPVFSETKSPIEEKKQPQSSSPPRQSVTQSPLKQKQEVASTQVVIEKEQPQVVEVKETASPEPLKQETTKDHVMDEEKVEVKDESVKEEEDKEEDKKEDQVEDSESEEGEIKPSPVAVAIEKPVQVKEIQVEKEDTPMSEEEPEAEGDAQENQVEPQESSEHEQPAAAPENKAELIDKEIEPENPTEEKKVIAVNFTGEARVKQIELQKQLLVRNQVTASMSLHKVQRRPMSEPESSPQAATLGTKIEVKIGQKRAREEASVSETVPGLEKKQKVSEVGERKTVSSNPEDAAGGFGGISSNKSVAITMSVDDKSQAQQSQVVEVMAVHSQTVAPASQPTQPLQASQVTQQSQETKPEEESKAAPTPTPAAATQATVTKKTMSQAEIISQLEEFDKKLDQLGASYGIKTTLKLTQNEEAIPQIAPLTDVDYYISFETKVQFVADFFENYKC